MKPNNTTRVCKWIGDGEGCRHPTIYGKSYCEVHHNRMYTSLLPQMADYIIDKNLHVDDEILEYKKDN